MKHEVHSHLTLHRTLSRPAYRLKPAALAIQVLFAGAMLLSATPASLYAAEPVAAAKAATRNFSIPAGPLSGAIARFSAQSGTYVSVNGALTDGKQSQGVQGNLSVPEAITKLLAGSGLEAIAQPNGSLSLIHI